jgi:hypothetical protein
MPFSRTDELPKLLKKKYRYLSEGGTSFAFISEDKKTVLKCFKTPAGMLKQYDEWQVPLTRSTSRKQQIKAAKIKIARDFRSSWLSYNLLKNETGLLYIHAAPRPLPVKSVTVDGRAINLEKLPFIFQKSATLITDRLKMLKAAGEKEKVLQTIEEVADFTISLWSKGWVDASLFFHHNIGYQKDGMIMQVDTGDFLSDKATRKQKRETATDYIKFSSEWLKDNFNDLQPAYTERMIDGLRKIT